VEGDIFSIIPGRVGEEASFSLARDIAGCQQSTTTSEARCEMIFQSQFAPANNGISAGNVPSLHTTEPENNVELKCKAAARQLGRIAKIDDLLAIW
jgi:hypothetical protein